MYPVVRRSQPLSETSRTDRPSTTTLPRPSSIRAQAHMSLTLETIEPSAVLETVHRAGTNGCVTLGGRSSNAGSYPVAQSSLVPFVIDASLEPIPNGPRTLSRTRSWIGIPVIRSRIMPTSL